eukprot:TRINITY_DN27881_c0_g1_i1.p1 TRINITY_DN27881_c0_g1~~TRINITY_DN27881_c0_g1_i1.p1  ORF type:complete len:187 (-),score=50.64 TRINITY_DN27881_c0_g1_i1:60-620(-)
MENEREDSLTIIENSPLSDWLDQPEFEKKELILEQEEEKRLKAEEEEKQKKNQHSAVAVKVQDEEGKSKDQVKNSDNEVRFSHKKSYSTGSSIWSFAKSSFENSKSKLNRSLLLTPDSAVASNSAKDSKRGILPSNQSSSEPGSPKSEFLNWEKMSEKFSPFLEKWQKAPEERGVLVIRPLDENDT